MCFLEVAEVFVCGRNFLMFSEVGELGLSLGGSRSLCVNRIFFYVVEAAPVPVPTASQGHCGSDLRL